jgi:hypothetical protein
MKVKIVQNGGYIFAVKEENICKEKKRFYNLTSLNSSIGETVTCVPLESRKTFAKFLFGLKNKTPLPGQMLDNDIIRKPTLEEYLFISAMCKQDGIVYNKKKDEAKEYIKITYETS